MSFEDGDASPPARDLAPGTHRLVLRGAIASLVRARRHEQLFEQIEQRGLLIKQADGLGAFTAAGEGLEVHALPAIVERGDWSRFLRYSLLALNLRHLAESLAEPVILAALARGGREKLALDVADRIADPLRRAVARAQLAEACREVSPDAFRKLVPEVQADLEENVPPPLDPAEVEGYAAGLAAVARCLGSDLPLSHWSGWIQKLVPSPPAALRVRTAVAEAYLDHSGPDHEDLWQALAAVGDPGTLLRIVPAHLGPRPLPDLDAVLERLAGLLSAPGSASSTARPGSIPPGPSRPGSVGAPGAPAAPSPGPWSWWRTGGGSSGSWAGSAAKPCWKGSAHSPKCR
jgi:hypothetical protein